MRASVVVNRKSSRSERHIAGLPEALAARGIEVASFETVASEAELRKALKRLVKARTELIVVGGGDGSQTTAADVLAHSEVALGVLPLGTGNSFALTLGLSDSLDDALDTIAAGRIVSIDLGVVNGTHFANFATIGLSAEIADEAPHDLKKLVGPLAYAFGGIKSFFTHRPFRARVAWDSGKSSLQTQQIVIANGRYFGKQPVSADASIVDRRLAFFTTTGISHVEVARMYVAMGLGMHQRLPDAVSFSAKAIVVKAKPKQLISIDGNTLGKTPARFSVAPRALRVCVPAGFDDARR